MVPFKIQVTQEILHQCKNAGVPGDDEVLGNVCPIAVTIKNMFPNVYVADDYLYPYGQDSKSKIELPPIARHFINVFDSLRMMPNVRLKIPAFEFEIEIPDEVIEGIKVADVLEEECC
ncbi:MAG: hypothetical protein JST87_16575 [Bacteroidetes bacterium]|nr:hypothetical protein [Bacteroidota bacterium]